MPPDNLYSVEETDCGTTTGFFVIRDIRKVSNNVPILICSIRRGGPSRETLERLNIKDYLEKPITASHLAVAIFECLGQHQ
jgi:DNA-binding response OmpR family regulator